MDKVNLVDFDVSIERTEGGYRARVINSPAGFASAKFSLPFSDTEKENFMLKLGQPRGGGTRRIESHEMETAKAFGGKLFNAVFVDEVKSCLRSSLDEVREKEAGLRIRLRLSDVPELADLPWEYLFNPSLNRFLVLSKDTPLVRYLDLPERIPPLRVKPPLRVLAMISSPTDYPPLDVEREWQKLNDSLAKWVNRGLISLTRLESASLMALQRQLRADDYHIFHFIGHGGFDERAQDGVLLLETQDKRGHLMSGQNLGTILHDERTLRLAVLNACEGARAASTDLFGGVSQSLVQQGIPAVIGMQFEISDEAAITFSREFYGAIASAYPVDAALSEARKAIFGQGNAVEWGTPVLYMRSPDGRIFDLPAGIEDMLDSSVILPAVRPPAVPVAAASIDQKQTVASPVPVAADKSVAAVADPIPMAAPRSVPSKAIPAPVVSTGRETVRAKSGKSPLLYLGIGGGILAAAAIVIMAFSLLRAGSWMIMEMPTATLAVAQAAATVAPVEAAATMVSVEATATMVSVEATATTIPVPATATLAPVEATATVAPALATATMAPAPATATTAPVQAIATRVPLQATATTAPKPTETPTVANEPRAVTQVSPIIGAQLRSSIVTFQWSGGALQPGETFVVEIIPNQANKGGCTEDYGSAGLAFSPPLTDHQWTTDIKTAGKAQPCPGRIEWIVHIKDAAGNVVLSAPRVYFQWNPL